MYASHDQLLADELCVATGSNTKNGLIECPTSKLCVVADGYGDTAVGTRKGGLTDRP